MREFKPGNGVEVDVKSSVSALKTVTISIKDTWILRLSARLLLQINVGSGILKIHIEEMMFQFADMQPSFNKHQQLKVQGERHSLTIHSSAKKDSISALTVW